MKAIPSPPLVESTPSTCTTPCCRLLLLEHGTSHSGLAFQLAAEVLRWPEEVAFQLYADGSTTLPAIPVTNKYFSTRVGVTIVTDEDRSNMVDTPTELGQRLPQNSTASTGCVIVVDGSMRPERIMWDSVPKGCLFRVLVVFGNATTTTRGGIWHDACVSNGFECVSHSNKYEVVPKGVEASGLLGGDICGAARILQILHNTLWPEEFCVPRCSNSDNGNATNRSSNNNNNIDTNRNNKKCENKDSKRQTPQKHGGMLENTMVLIGIHTRDIIDWFGASLKDRRFFAMEWPPQKERQPYQKMITTTTTTTTTNNNNNNNNDNKTMLAIANKYYTAMVGVEYMHPALFFPAMEDLFITQYSNRCPQLVVLCWPPPAATRIRKPHTCTDECDFPPLSVYIERLQRWGVKEYILLVSEKGALSPKEEYYCAENSIEVLHMKDYAIDMYDTREFGPIGADRLAEIIHTTTWPQRHSIPARTTSLSSSSSTSVSSALLKEKRNRLLVWAVGTSPAAEELLLHTSLAACLPVSSSRGPEKSMVLSVPISSMQSSSLCTPVRTVRVVNKYFEANVDVHCFGGARSAVLRESYPDPELLQAFGVVILVTTSAAVEAVVGEEEMETARSIQDRLLQALEKCCAAQDMAQDTCSLLSLVAYDEHQGTDITGELSEAAENTPVYMWYIVDGDASNNNLTTQVDALLLQAAASSTCKEADMDRRAAKQDCVELLHDRDDVIDESNKSSTSTGNMDSTFLALPLEVLYGVDEQDVIVHLRDSVEQHVWPYRTMLKDTLTESTPAVSKRHEEKEEVVEDASLYIGCELPPNYLVDPLTGKSEYVAALAVTTVTRTNPEMDGEPIDERQQQQLQEDLMVWMDKMKHHGHKLPRSVRLLQAELLANRLGECLGALGGS